MTYRCPSCDELRDEDICPVCAVPTEPVSSETALSPLPQGGEGEEAAPPPPPAPEPSPPAPEPSPPAPEPSPSAPPLIPQAGQQQLAQYVDDGYEVYLIAGIAASGKTQLLDAYRKDAYLSSFVKRQGMALPTSPNQLDCHPVSLGRRKVVFVDTSGEHFKRLYPHLSPTGEITESEIDFLRLISRRLSGLVLLVDLYRLWNPSPATPEDEAQIDILTWVLILLRWLRQGGEVRVSRLRFHDHVNREVMRYRKRLDVPVSVLFSRADEMTDLPIPSTPGPAWMRASGNAARDLFPVGESPLLLAHHRLPELLEMLRTHVDHFRFDFVHSMVTDRDTGEIVDPDACGAALSLAWLLDPDWRWPTLPTRHWIGWQRFLDEKIRRNDHWRRLPDPEDAPEP